MFHTPKFQGQSTEKLLVREESSHMQADFTLIRIYVVHKHSVHTAQETHTVSVIKTNQLMLYREIIAVCSQIHTKHINTLCGQNVELLNVKLVLHKALKG